MHKQSINPPSFIKFLDFKQSKVDFKVKANRSIKGYYFEFFAVGKVKLGMQQAFIIFLVTASLKEMVITPNPY